VRFFALRVPLAAPAELGPRHLAAAQALLPGGVTLLLPNPRHRWPLACAPDPDTLGLRVPDWPEPLVVLGGVRWPVLQSSANDAGGPDARTLAEVPERIRRAADLLLDGGTLPGTPSTVVDLRRFELDAHWSIVREGAVPAGDVARALAAAA